MHIILCALAQLLDETHRLARLSGNCGRVMARFFQRYFPRDELVIECDLPRSAPLYQALYLQEVQQRVARAQAYCAQHGLAFALSCDPFDPQLPYVRVRVSLLGGMPESVRARRERLLELSLVFERLASLAQLGETRLRERANTLLQECASDPTDPAQLALGLARFDALVAGDLSQAPATPSALAALAQLVRPSLAAAL
jgi:hypothetical protein